MGQTIDDHGSIDSETVDASIREDLYLSLDDHVATAGFDEDTGRAQATVHFGTCFNSSQVEDIRRSDTWQVGHVHPSVDGVRVHLREDMGDE